MKKYTANVALFCLFFSVGITLFYQGLEYPVGASFKGLGLGIASASIVILLGAVAEGLSKKPKPRSAEKDRKESLAEPVISLYSPQWTFDKTNCLDLCKDCFIVASVVEMLMRETKHDTVSLPTQCLFEDVVTVALTPASFFNEKGQSVLATGNPDPTGTAARFWLGSILRQLQESTIEDRKDIDDTAMEIIHFADRSDIRYSLDDIEYLKHWSRDMIEGERKTGTDIELYEELVGEIANFVSTTTKWHQGAGLAELYAPWQDVDPNTPVRILYENEIESRVLRFNEADWEIVVDWQYATVCSDSAFYVHAAKFIPMAFRDVEDQRRMIGVWSREGQLMSYGSFLEDRQNGYAFQYFDCPEHYDAMKQMQEIHLETVLSQTKS